MEVTMARSRKTPNSRGKKIHQKTSPKSTSQKRSRQSAGVKAYWASLSPAARRKRIKASVEGRGLVYRPKR
jgi:hypothetical protein